MRTLIVDSNPVRQRQLRSILTNLGIPSSQVEVAHSHAAAVDEMRHCRYDVCFTALLGEPRDLIDFVHAVRSGGLNGATRLIALSGDAAHCATHDVLKAGVSSVLTVPFTTAEVKALLRGLDGPR